jgi:hypothetical protein
VVERSDMNREGVRVFAQTRGLIDRYLDDPGALVTFLLNNVVLAAGRGIVCLAPRVHLRFRGSKLQVPPPGGC